MGDGWTGCFHGNEADVAVAPGPLSDISALPHFILNDKVKN
jgi:hypothetical protein